MPSREELASALAECLREVGSLLEHAHMVALQQQDALIKNDAEALTASCAAQEEVVRMITQTDQRAAALADQIAEDAGLGEADVTPEAIAEAAGVPYSVVILRELTRIPDLAQRVREANEINSHLLRNGLEIIASCLRIVAGESEPSTYSKDASKPSAPGSAISLNSLA